MKWKMGTRLIIVTRVQDPQDPVNISNIFEQGITVEQISGQQMRKMAQKEAGFLAVIRTINDKKQTNQIIVTVNEDSTKTAFLDQV